MVESTSGILQPVLKHRFRLEFDNNADLTTQVMLFKPDYFNKVLSIKFREDVLGIVRAGLKNISMDGCQDVRCVVFDGNHKVLYTDIFQSLSMVGYTTEFDYNKGEGVEHSVVLSFGSVQTEKA